VKQGDTFSSPDTPHAFPYKTNQNGHIEWKFTNRTDAEINVRIDNFTCAAAPHYCPLVLEPRGTIDCRSDVSIPIGKDKVIFGDANDLSACANDLPDIWDYQITVNGLPLDPELEIDRGYLRRVIGKLRGLLLLIRRSTHS